MPLSRWLTPGGLGQRALTPEERERIADQIARLKAIREQLDRLLRLTELHPPADHEKDK